METNSFRAFVRITALESARSATRDEIRASRLLICPVVLCLVGGTVFPSVCRKNITKKNDCVVAFDGKLPPSLLARNDPASFALMRNYLDFIVNIQNTVVAQFVQHVPSSARLALYRITQRFDRLRQP